MTTVEIDKLIRRIKNAISKAISKERYEEALEMIAVCANVLYETNIRYTDKDLESFLAIISSKITHQRQCSSSKDQYLLYFDGFGLNDRGLAQIYMKALCQFRNVIYVTYEDCKHRIPDIINIINEYGALSYYINRDKRDYICQIEQIEKILTSNSVKEFVLYSTPDDVVATTLMYAYDGQMTRFQVDLTDHAFWLGAGCTDCCIEYRDYGACISRMYRGIEEDRIVKLPFYPVIHTKRSFHGFPFSLGDNQKIMFSGGALYKTFGDEKYYSMVDYLLCHHEDLVFWYAGSGDTTKINKIIDKYPERAFYTKERDDLYQVLEHSDIFLNTYPIVGGLMFQYAASAGVVPLTLKTDERASGFLLNQSQLRVEFDSEEDLYIEAEKILGDDGYKTKRGEELRSAVISEKDFTDWLEDIINKCYISNRIRYSDVDTTEFRKLYLRRMTKRKLHRLMVKRGCFRTMMLNFPIETIDGIIQAIRRG